MSRFQGLFRIPLTAALFTIVSCAIQPSDDDFRARWSDMYTKVAGVEDVEAEVRFGREVAARLLGNQDGIDSELLKNYVNTLGQYLVQYSGRDDITFYFWVLESQVVNAYALPGGYIFVTSAAIKLMKNEAELAGVLAHEIAHVREKHVVNALNIKGKESGATLTQLSAGASDAFRVAFDQAAGAALSILQEDGLQKSDEFEADEIGLLIMVQAGYEPSAYHQYLARLDSTQSDALTEVSKTHPSFAERVNHLKNMQKEYDLENLNYALMEDRFNRNQP